jgi:uncharacterized protein YhdP
VRAEIPVEAASARHPRPPARTGRRLPVLLGVLAFGLAVVALLLLRGIDSFKPGIQAAVSEATGLEVRIAGKIALSFSPFGVSAEDVRVAWAGAEIGSVKSVKVGLELLPLLRGRVEITDGELVEPAATIVREADGHLNVEGAAWTRAGRRRSAPFSLKTLRISGGMLSYLDRRTSEKTELSDLDLTIHDLLVPDGPPGHLLRNSSLEGSLACGEVRAGGLRIAKVESSLTMERGVIHLERLTMDVFGGKGEGDAAVDASGAEAVYTIHLKVSNLDLAALEEASGAGKAIGGRGQLQASLTLREKGGRPSMSTVDGTLSLRGDDLTTYTVDLDKALSSYEASQRFSVIDLGAYFVAGPLSVVALKGLGFGKAYAQAGGGQGTITQLITHWKIEDGVAEAVDCALATRHHRVALKGRLNLVTGRYQEGTVVALLDEKGCASHRQTLGGQLGSPQVGAAGAAQSLGGPVIDLFRKAKRFLQGGRCEVFYAGAVQQPPG